MRAQFASNGRHRIFFAVALLLLVPGWLEAQLVINFDTDLSGAPLAPGTVINSTYAARGVTLRSESAATLCGSPAAVYANSDKPFGAGSGLNVASSCPQGVSSAISQNLHGTIHATFRHPAIQVCIDVIPDSPSDFATFSAFSDFDRPGQGVFSAPGAAQTLCVTPYFGLIRRVQFTGSGTRLVRFDNLTITFSASISPGADANPFGLGDGKSDFAIYRVNGSPIFGSCFCVALSTGLGTGSLETQYLGFAFSSQTVLLPGRWRQSNSNQLLAFASYAEGRWFYGDVIGFGGTGFSPVQADYDGDGFTDVAVYSGGTWSILASSNGGNTIVAHGGPGWTPAPRDYDGDGKADIAVHIDGAWSIINSWDGSNTVVAHGGPTWQPVPADYDGDGKADIAVYSNGLWSIIRSSDGGNMVIGHGLSGWIPVPGDYDGDGKADAAVYLNGVWSVKRSSDGGNTIVIFGGDPTDVPLN